jgi:hypothetical protein
MLKVAFSSSGAWHLAGTGSMQTALSNAVLRRIRKTVRTMVWEGDGAQFPSLDPIKRPEMRSDFPECRAPDRRSAVDKVRNLSLYLNGLAN